MSDKAIKYADMSGGIFADIPAFASATVKDARDFPARTEEPVAFIMSGIPGAGKSSFLKSAAQKGLLPFDAYCLDPDATMKSMPQYRADYAALGADKAYELWELPARKAAYDGFEAAIASRRHVVIDMACARAENLDMVTRLAQAGYYTRMVRIDCDVDTAYARAVKRDRPMPKARIVERAAGIAALEADFRALVDEYHILDNADSARPYRLVASHMRKVDPLSA